MYLKLLVLLKGPRKKELKWDLRGEEDKEQHNLMEAELELLAEERSHLILEEEKAKGELRERQRMFEEEASKPDNSKLEGQIVRAEMKGIFKDNGIDYGEFWVGDIQENGCRKLISCGGDITKCMLDFLQSMPAGQKNCSHEEIGDLFRMYAQLLDHLEAFFSILCKKQFHLNDSPVDKAMRHSDVIHNLWGYLNMSVTPKLYLLFVHLLRFLERVQGFDDLGEDASE